MTDRLSPLPISLTQFFYAIGKLVRPARLFFYKPDTEDRVTVYTDPGLRSAARSARAERRLGPRAADLRRHRALPGAHLRQLGRAHRGHPVAAGQPAPAGGGGGGRRR